MPTLSLIRIPGFSDLPDASLISDSPALAIYLNRISNNSAFGMVRFEVFHGLYTNGQTVGLPVSPFDGYNYSRDELNYAWSIANSTNPTSGWITGPDSLWWCAWEVDQNTGLVSSVEAYRKSGSHPDQQSSNDGTLGVFTIAQRINLNILISPQLTAYTDLADTEFVTDKPLSQRLIRGLNHNAKFGVVNAECIYMGEFYNGQTVPRPVSPDDGYQYTYAETFFHFSWRWTVLGSAFTQPDMGLGQLDRIGATVSSVGVVATSVFYKGSGSPALASGHGRIAVFAFCSRSDLINTIPSLSNAFSEISTDTFMPAETLRASSLLQLNKNIREAVCSPEFFGPANYNSGDTVPLPTSTQDGYAYTRAEIFYVWDWAHTTPQTTGEHFRLPAFNAKISSTTGVVTVGVFRLPPGGPYVAEPSGDSDDAIRVLVVAIRGASHPALIAPGQSTPGDSGSQVVDNGPADIQPYAISYFEGDTATPTASQLLLRHAIPGSNALQSAGFPSGLTGSKCVSVTAATAAYVITIKTGTTIGSLTTVGTINFAIGATVGTFSFSSPVTSAPGDFWDFVGQATPDATLAGISFTLSGTRT